MTGPASPRPRLSAGKLAVRFGPLVLVAALAIAAYASGLLHHLTLAELGVRRAPLEAYVALEPLLSAAIYVLIFAIGVTLSLPIALVLTMAGGFLFGPAEGGVLAAVSSTIGGVVIFLISRTAAGDLLRRFAGPRVQKMQLGVQKDSLSLILTLRLIPMMPFWVINVGAAVMGMPLRTFLTGTALGVVPSSFIYASLGSGLGRLFDSGTEPSLDMLRRPEVLAPLVALVLLAAGSLAWRKVRPRSEAPAESAQGL